VGIGLVDGRGVVGGWTFLSLHTTVQGMGPMLLSINDTAIIIDIEMMLFSELELITDNLFLH